MVLEPPRQAVTLKDGRTLAYLTYGLPLEQAAAGGRVALHLHGSPACAAHGGWLGRHAAAAGLCLVAPDRPGMGGSSLDPGMTLASVAGDVGQLMDALKVPRLAAVCGESGGGPYAAACAALLGPARVAQLHLVAGMGPVWDRGPGGRHHELWKALTDMDSRSIRWQRWPWRPLAIAYHRLLKLVAERKPDLIRSEAADDMGPDDQALLKDSRELQDAVVALMQGAFHPGVAGTLKDFEVLGGEWTGVDVGAISPEIKAFVWQGGTDWCVKPVHSQYMAAAIPHATLRTLEGEGHLTMAWRRGAEILAEVGK